MSICGVCHHHRSRPFSCRPQLAGLPHCTNPTLLLQLQGRRPKPYLPLKLKHDSTFKFATAAASSPSLPGQYSGNEMTPKQNIAGVDQEELEDASILADPDSCFCEFKGVQIHHKICDADLSEDIIETQVSDNTKKAGFGLPMILLHGFGASVFSWNRVMKPLARVTGSKVLAFDRPAFGLTSRVDPTNQRSEDTKPLNPYSMMFSVLASLYFMDFLAAEKTILVGHSAGSLVAVDTYFEAPERVAAMVLVAPAIFAPLVRQRDKNSQKQEEHSEETNSHNLLKAIFSSLSKFAKFVAHAILTVFRGMGNMIDSLYKKALSTFLRSAIGVMLIRFIIGRFGTAAVRNAWYDSIQVTDHVLEGYVKPLRVKGWDKALVEYTIAMLTDSSSQSKPPMTKRLSEISCPVLIITGDSDRLVPAWNSKRLSQIIPGSCLEVINNCGHLPHEEKVQEFVSIVEKFLQRSFGATQEQQNLQAVT